MKHGLPGIENGDLSTKDGGNGFGGKSRKWIPSRSIRKSLMKGCGGDYWSTG
jgi:hypothetical protein